ncbi:hypothetical protein [Paludibaculum fermentans]|uniref:hypothetical protein n=1 Tax=Paludibaculum fermentans TaxID=1473598 RepID=UPI003EB87A6D
MKNWITLAILCGAPAYAQPAPVVEKRSLGLVTQASLNVMKAHRRPPDAAVSDDGRRLARVRMAGSRPMVELDGVPSQPWDEVGTFGDEQNPGQTATRLIFDPKGEKLAYTAREGTRTVLVVDNKPVDIDPYSLKNAGIFRFSPDGSLYVMIVANRTKATSWAIVNGVRQGPYAKVDSVTFSGDGKHAGYLAQKGQSGERNSGIVAVVDGVESPVFATVRDLQSSFDGRHWVYTARVPHTGAFGEGHRVYVDGKPLPGRYQSVADLQISADGKHVGFIGTPTEDGANASGDPRTVIDGVNGKPYMYVAQLRLSPNGLRHAYYAYRKAGPAGERLFFVVDGKETRDYENHPGVQITFSPDSSSIGLDIGGRFLLVNGEEYPAAGLSRGSSLQSGPRGPTLAFRTRGDDNIERVFVNGKKGPDLISANLDNLAFNDEGTRAAYTGIDLHNKLVLVAGEQVYPLPGMEQTGFFFPDSPARRIVWSADGTHVAVNARRVVVDGKVGPECGSAAMPLFSPDAKHFAFSCPEYDPPTHQTKFGIYLDGQRALAVDAYFSRQPGTWRFAVDGTLEVLAMSGLDVTAFRITPPASGMSGFSAQAGPATVSGTALPGADPAAANQPNAGGATPANPVGTAVENAAQKLKAKFPKIFGGKQ